MSAGVRASERLTGVWTVVPDACRAGFRVKDKVFGQARGTMPVRSGTVRVGPDGDVESARVEIDVAAIDTGNAHRDRDLRKPHFLSADEHPTIVVEAGPAVSEAVAAAAAPDGMGWRLAATLTARGIPVPVDLAVSLESVADGSVTVAVTGRLDRTPLRMKAPTFIVGRMIDIDVCLTFRR